jgi:hypothetical protein
MSEDEEAPTTEQNEYPGAQYAAAISEVDVKSIEIGYFPRTLR